MSVIDVDVFWTETTTHLSISCREDWCFCNYPCNAGKSRLQMIKCRSLKQEQATALQGLVVDRLYSTLQ